MPVTRFGSAVLTAVILSGAAITNNAATVAKLDALEAGSSSTVLEGTLRNVHHPLLWQGPNGLMRSPLLVDGRITGYWRAPGTAKRRPLELHALPGTRLPGKARLEEPVTALGAALGITITEVSLSR